MSLIKRISHTHNAQTEKSKDSLIQEIKDAAADRHGNVGEIYSWVINEKNTPQHFSASGETFLRKYDYKNVILSENLTRVFKIRDIQWYDDDGKDISKRIQQN